MKNKTDKAMAKPKKKVVKKKNPSIPKAGSMKNKY